MSSFSFTHQFSQRWLATYPPVKYAIIQELDDIATLLQPETQLNDYEFAVPNLHDHVQNLLVQEQERQEIGRIEAERIEQLRQEAVRREELKREQEHQEKIRQEKEALEQQRLAREKEAQAERERVEKDREAQARLDKIAEQQAQEARQAKLMIQREQLKKSITADLNEHMEKYIQVSLQDSLKQESQKLRDELLPWIDETVEKQLAEQWETLQANNDKIK